MGLGEGAALAAAILWAFASLLYAETRLTAWGMNFSKLVIAAGILLVQLLVVSAWHTEPPLSADGSAWLWLGVSGFVGLTVGDTFYFRSLQILGARRCLIVTTTAPVFAAILGWLLLGEVLLWLSILGIALTVGGIMWVVMESDGRSEEPGHYPGSQRQGIAYGLASSVCQAVGAVAAKLGMEQTGALEATFIRMLLAASFAFVVVVGRRQLASTIREVARRDVLARFLPAIICGTWLGVWFSLIAFEQTASVGIAQTLLATCPLFAIPLVRYRYGIPITLPALAGSVVAVLGICLIVLPGPEPQASSPTKASEAAVSASERSTVDPAVTNSVIP